MQKMGLECCTSIVTVYNSIIIPHEFVCKHHFTVVVG